VVLKVAGSCIRHVSVVFIVCPVFDIMYLSNGTVAAYTSVNDHHKDKNCPKKCSKAVIDVLAAGVEYTSTSCIEIGCIPQRCTLKMLVASSRPRQVLMISWLVILVSVPILFFDAFKL
jgi:hypothetical protein